MNSLITGASGFIGAHLVKALVRQGHQVKVLVRPTSDISLLEKLGVEMVQGNLGQDNVLRKAVAGAECVYHLAAGTSKHRLSKADYYTRNREATKNLGVAALEAGVKRFVYASSVGVYGMNTNRAIDENTPPCPDSYYRETKLAGEKELLRLQRDGGLPVVIVRLGHVYGPGSRVWLGLYRKIQKRDLRIIGSGKNHDHFIYIDDVVEGLLKCGRREGIEGKIYILTAPQPSTLNEMVAAIASALGVDSSFGHLPAFPFRAYRRFTQFVYRTFGVQLPRAGYYDMFLIDHICTSTNTRDDLDFVPRVGLAEGVRRQIEWYRDEGEIEPRLDFLPPKESDGH
jgi:nucleoside-diphosphate-sugar epimerase